jgi:predicted ATPase
VKREKSGSGWRKISRKIVPCWLRPTNYTTNKWTKKWIGCMEWRKKQSARNNNAFKERGEMKQGNKRRKINKQAKKKACCFFSFF